MTPIFDPRVYTRQISNAAYDSALASGLISAKRRIVYNYIWEHAPCCQAEAVRDLASKNTNDGVITTRFSELGDMDAIQIVGFALSPVNPKQTVGFYDITGRVRKLIKKKSVQFWAVRSESSGKAGYLFKLEESARRRYLEFVKEFPDAEIFKVRKVAPKRRKAQVVKPE